MTGEPYPKERQLARRERRYRRKVASPKQWQAIIAAKGGPCRICGSQTSNGHVHGSIHFHHLIPRARGGDDVEDNIVPLCGDCHDRITRGDHVTTRLLAAALTFEERRYVRSKPGGQAWAAT